MFGCKLNSQYNELRVVAGILRRSTVMCCLQLGLDMTVIGCLDSGAMLVSWCHESTHASVSVAPLPPLQAAVLLLTTVTAQCTAVSRSHIQTNTHFRSPMQNRAKMSLKISKNMTFEILFVSELSNLAINIKLQNLQIKLHSVVIVTMLILTMKIFDVLRHFSWHTDHIVEETTSAENCLDFARSCEIIPSGDGH